jgi:CubicO group peptidase (beta-lactamase class C family)
MTEIPSDDALAQLHGLELDEAAMAAHVMRPDHLDGVVSDRGPEDLAALEERPVQAGVTYRLDVQGFATALNKALQGSVAGYAFQLNQNGAPIATTAWEWAKAPQDGGQRWLPNVRMHVASLSKNVTAIAMVRLLNEKQLAYTTKIIGYLPAYWAKGQNINAITFAQLFTHTSGLAYGIATSASDYQFMKAQVAAGTTHVGQYSYQNMNFGLCRILLATVNGNVPVNWQASDAQWDYATITAYQNYVQARVFALAGVAGPTLTHPPEDALAYNFPVSGSGWNSGDLTTMAGGAGWHMSIEDLLKVMGTFRRAGTIVTPAQAQLALNEKFGIDWAASTPLGTVYAKNGMWGDAAGRVEQSVLFYLPENMELVVLVNSPVSASNLFLYTLVSNCYTQNIKSS